MQSPIFSVIDAVAVLNQTLSSVYPTMTIVGELESFKIAKQRWVYADLKDDQAKLRLFGTIYHLPGPLEDGMLVEVVAEPRLHPQFGFSLQLRAIRPVGEGSLKKAADKLEAKLTKEGLFAEERKRTVPYPPEKVALITADGSAAMADFMKITAERWPLLTIDFIQSSVQGVNAPEKLMRALTKANESTAEAIVMIRGGGSADDLSAFSDERVVRAVAGSRIPTVVAIGHEVDTSLAEKAADMAASTPSNAAELLVPDRKDVLNALMQTKVQLTADVHKSLKENAEQLITAKNRLAELSHSWIQTEAVELAHTKKRFDSYHPKHTLQRGYALLWDNENMIKAGDTLKEGSVITVQRAHEKRKVKVQGKV